MELNLMSNQEAPIVDPMVDESRKCRPSWMQYFATLEDGDVGQSFTPTFTNLTVVGTPTISGVYYQNQGMTYFAVKIVPSTSTSSVLGSTSFTLPFNVSADTSCFAVTGVSSSLGTVNAASKTVYTPTWTGITTPITITGMVKS